MSRPAGLVTRKHLGPRKDIIQRRAPARPARTSPHRRVWPGTISSRYQPPPPKRVPPVGLGLGLLVCLIGLECKVFMVRISFDRSPSKLMMRSVRQLRCQPQQCSNAGRAILEKMPATRQPRHRHLEAIEQAVTDPSGKTRYSGQRAQPRPAPQTIIASKPEHSSSPSASISAVIGCAAAAATSLASPSPSRPTRSTAPRSTSFPSSLPPVRD